MRLGLLYDGLYPSLAAHLLLAGLLLLVSWSTLNATLALIWLLLLLLVLVGRLFSGYWYRCVSSSVDFDVERSLRIFRVGAFLSGLTWGIGIWLLFPADELAIQVFFAFVVAGMCAGGMTSLAPDRISALLLITPALLPLISHFLLQADPMSLSMSGMILLFLLFLVATGGRLQKVLQHNDQLMRSISDSEAQFRALVDNIPGITYRCLADEHWTMIFMSDQVDPLSGYPASDFINNAVRSYASVIHPDDRAMTDRVVQAALKAGNDWQVEYRIVHHDGSFRWAMERGAAVRSLENEVICLDGFILDITEQKQGIKQIKNQLRAFATLHEIVSGSVKDLRQQLQQALRLGSDYLELDLGIVSCIKSTSYEVFACVAPKEMPIHPGQVFQMGQTYCDLTLRQGDLVAVDHVGQSAFSGHPCYKETSLEVYLGMPVEVAGQVFGTLSFTGRMPRDKAFSDGEKMFVRLLARWVGAVIAGDRADQALQLNTIRLRGLFELSPLGIALNDFETGRFLEVNETLVQAVGYSRAELLSLSHLGLTPGHYWKQESVQVKKLLDTDRFGPYEKEFVRKDGSSFPVLLNGMLVVDPDGRKLVWSIIEDMTDRKRIERMKDQFVSTVSHELRTPLTSIAGALGLLAGGVMEHFPEKTTQLIDIAHSNSKRLISLINDLLDMDKLLEGQMKFSIKTHPLFPLLKQSIHDNQLYADQYAVQLKLQTVADADLLVRVDEQRLQQIMANLLSNAAKFSPAGSEVTIDLQLLDASVKVRVIDQGPGIPEDFRSRIFEKFSQLDGSSDRLKGGTGLGLAITRELVEQMGGSIGFDTVTQGGTCFWFELQRVSRFIPGNRIKE
ncbi:PAS domain S-box-containing protein [Marinospirillum celere]|uniref:histidine kinase n=2 Tax=Marinospirillum celere TaxID=1122252 RepID=A0A1I1JBS9_9GAMM|nr:PAS domain S-box-containing protein [Marinospirillum celere]